MTPPHRPPKHEPRAKPDPERLRLENEQLRRQLELMRQKLAEAEERISDLERKLSVKQQNSTTSSKPPSSDGLAGKQRKRCRSKQSKRKVGGQPGHRGAHRPLAPPERVSEIRPVLPCQCLQCGQALPPRLGEAQTDGTVRRHQVAELPPIQAHIIEYQCHGVICPECGKATKAAIPAEASGQFGPELTALIVHLTVVCRLPRRVVERLLEQALGIEISLGSTQKCWEEASQAVAGPCQELAEKLKSEPVINADETGWRTNGDKRFLWVFLAAQYVVYTIEATRSSEVLIRLLGSVFQGILCSDRFSGYLKYHKGRGQFCWAHLKRNILGALELTKDHDVEQFCRDALAEHAKLFRLWHKFRDGRIDRRQLQLRSIPIEKRLFALGERHLDSSNRDVRNLAAVLFEHIPRLFLFVEQEGVEPTNNGAERELRPLVQARKVSFGNRSANGELATSRLFTVAETCRLQGLDVLAYLAAAINSHRRRQQPASLLPR